MQRRLVAFASVVTLGTAAACSSSPTSTDESGSSANDERSTRAQNFIDDESPPIVKGGGIVINPISCADYSAPANQCGTTYVSHSCVSDGKVVSSTTTADPACPDSNFCGGVPGIGVADVCGNPLPPGCTAIPETADIGPNSCKGTCDVDPDTNAPFGNCNLMQTTDYLTLAAPYFNVDATSVPSTALPCSVWYYLEDEPVGSDPLQHHKYYVAYCQNGTEPDGTAVMDDWVSQVNAANPTSYEWQTCDGAPGSTSDPVGWVLCDSDNELAGRDEAGGLPIDVPYNAVTTSQPHQFAAAAPGYIWVEFMANERTGSGCDSSSNDGVNCVLGDLPDPLPISLEPIESDPTAIPPLFGGY